MPHPLLNIVDLKLREMSHWELGHFVVALADALAAHPGHQGEDAFPHPVSKPVELKDLGNSYLVVTAAAESRDVNKIAQRDAMRPLVELNPAITVQWVVIRSVKEGNPSLIANLGLEQKKKKPARSAITSTVTTPAKATAKHGQHSGSVLISTPKVPKALTYDVGKCSGDPTAEDSWQIMGPFDHCRNIELTGLEPGKLYHFRVRCFGKGGYSPWSSIITLRVL